MHIKIRLNISNLIRLDENVKNEMDIEKILDYACDLLLYRIKYRFMHEESPEGVAWIPSQRGLIRASGGYTYRDGKKYTGTGTLFETGNLYHSIQLDQNKETGLRRIGTNVFYGPYLQYPSKDRPNMPPRVFLGWNDDDMKVVQNIIVSRLQRISNG